MRIHNVHTREFSATPKQVGALIDSLASSNDRLWPRALWPRMKLNKPLAIGAGGGHGPIAYQVTEYSLGSFIKFEFSKPKGFDGYHSFEVLKISDEKTMLRHTIKMNARGIAIIHWALWIRPLHDALVEDGLSTAGISLGEEANLREWSPWVKMLRWISSCGRARSQNFLSEEIQIN